MCDGHALSLSRMSHPKPRNNFNGFKEADDVEHVRPQRQSALRT